MKDTINFKQLLEALDTIEKSKNISKQLVIDALKEVLIKACRKNFDDPDMELRVEIDEKKKDIRIFQIYHVVEEVENDSFEMTLEEAQALNPDVQLGETVEEELVLDDLSRGAATLGRSLMIQKIREAEKGVIYDKFISQVGEMVIGVVESVDPRFVLVKIDDTVAMMPSSLTIPNEVYRKGEQIRVIISEVKKEGKGAQVVVSRSEALLVKRLFEKEVPEIFDGIIEIKAIARDAGERTKMAVYSQNPNIDPIGACIGPKGMRVQVVINELHGEKIDIFEWNEDIVTLVKRVIAPAEVMAVIPEADQKQLLVVVNDDQLSLAIGRKGKNVRLAVKLTGKKIDIKTTSELLEKGIDYVQLEREYLRRLEDEKMIAAAMQKQKENLMEAETKIEEMVSVQKEDAIEKEVVEEVVVEKTKENKKKKLLEAKPVEYVSVFEKLIGDSSKSKQENTETKRRKKKDEDEYKPRLKDLKKDLDYELKPEYSQEELDEIKRIEEEEANSRYDDYMDYEDYDDFYDED